MNPINSVIQTHYTRQDVGSAILVALEKSGKDLDRLTPEDLAPVDEFHVRGRASTMELAQAAVLAAGQRVLDVGSGIGGTARCLAREFGCRVTGIDLTDEYCRAATLLSARVGLAKRVDFCQGDATDLPFDDGVFDVVWTEHVAMNIPDKPLLYREMHRVLKPGGTLAIHDILAGSAGPVLFPVPWARTPQTSFLVEPNELRRLLIEADFSIADWSDTTELARTWFTSLASKIRTRGLPAVSLQLLLGADFKLMAENQGRNLQEGRIALAQVVAVK